MDRIPPPTVDRILYSYPFFRPRMDTDISYYFLAVLTQLNYLYSSHTDGTRFQLGEANPGARSEAQHPGGIRQEGKGQ